MGVKLKQLMMMVLAILLVVTFTGFSSYADGAGGNTPGFQKQQEKRQAVRDGTSSTW